MQQEQLPDDSTNKNIQRKSIYILTILSIEHNLFQTFYNAF